MAGAAVLAGRAALRGGAGLVRIATPYSAFPAVAARVTCCLTTPLPETRAGTISLGAGRRLEQWIRANDVLALGPGIGRHTSTDVLVRKLVADAPKPMVVDADGLNGLAPDVSALRRAAAPRVLTPHPGEMARLCGLETAADVQRRRSEAACEFARQNSCIVLLKGHQTVITDGDRLAVNQTGNPGMATAGSGDVLTGLIAALVAQGLEAYDAALLGAYLHGLAGDLARDRYGETALIASDILEFLPGAFQRHHGRD
jgi:NAD(P)H-hydrate epimerase